VNGKAFRMNFGLFVPPPDVVRDESAIDLLTAEEKLSEDTVLAAGDLLLAVVCKGSEKPDVDVDTGGRGDVEEDNTNNRNGLSCVDATPLKLPPARALAFAVAA